MDILDFLKQENIYINSVPGGHIISLYEAVCKKKSYDNFLSWRTEYGAGFGALGNIHATGNPSVVISTAGPGITSLVSPVAQANAESMPLIAIGVNNYSSDLDRKQGLFHEIVDSRQIFANIVYKCIRIESVEHFANSVIDNVLKMKNGQSKPVYLEVPSDIFADVFNYNFKNHHAQLKERDVIENYAKEVIKSISNSELPIIYVGWGVQLANAGDYVCQIAEKLGAIIVTTVKCRGGIPDSFSLNAGCIWDRVRSFDTLANKSDMVLAIGTSLSSLNSRRGKLPLPEKLYHINLDETMLKTNYAKSNTLNCEIRYFLETLLRNVEHTVTTEKIEKLKNLCSNIKEQWDMILKKEVPVVANLIQDIRQSYGNDTQFSLDMCQEAYWIQRYLPVENSYSLQMSFYFGNLGCGIPSAIGARVASKKEVVCIVGDGGFLYANNEIATAAKYNIPVKIILFNNNCFDTVRVTHSNIYKSDSEHYQIVNPNFEELAKSFKVDYYYSHYNNIQDIIYKAESTSKSYIIEVKSEEIPMFTTIKWQNMNIEI